MNTTTRWITIAASLFGLTGVALGALGAHAFKNTLILNGTLEAWKTAATYQMLHAAALLALAGWRDSHAGPSAKVAGFWMAGTILFSGSLYLLALGGPRILGPVTPLGGILFMVGWAWLAGAAWKKPTA